MKIFVASNDGQVAGRLGKCRDFIIYTIENRQVLTREVVKNTCKDAEQTCAFLIINNCDILIVGGLGEKAARTLAMTKMRIGINAKGEADNIIENLLNDQNFDLETEALHYTPSHGCGCGCCGECCEGDCEEEHDCCCGHHEEEHDCCCGHHDDHECCEHHEEEHHCCCHHHE